MAEVIQFNSVEELREIGLEEALARVGNAVYGAAIILEGFEDASKIIGNGHHAAQAIALEAQVELLERWHDSDEVTQLSPTHPAYELLLKRQHAVSRV
jgi:hypothetical protein